VSIGDIPIAIPTRVHDGPAIVHQELMSMAMEGAAAGKPAAMRLLAGTFEREAGGHPRVRATAEGKRISRHAPSRRTARRTVDGSRSAIQQAARGREQSPASKKHAQQAERKDDEMRTVKVRMKYLDALRKEAGDEILRLETDALIVEVSATILNALREAIGLQIDPETAEVGLDLRADSRSLWRNPRPS
jgi:hypothetical protein